ncbi:FAD-dependent oxidoreductase [Flavobacterium algicola]|uniref:FAD-dependent oxidoreductase n=1 Tax=Flavobacterium algicola TaxID=556529 RepID=UPI001EFC3B39|nr:NAD(P)/FAD-dependent oxidoreductase [Flavobacterium algicola]MCG9792223.1 FAD-dependent monooxygenase [Flavobacterium algicola]
MKEVADKINDWTICTECQGQGKKSRRINKKVRLQYQKDMQLFELSDSEVVEPIRPKAHLDSCSYCSGSGLLTSSAPTLIDVVNFPHISIIGGGIGGTALAVALLHRGIPFTLYERDSGFEARSQGYGLTLQQASKAIEGFGIFKLKQGVVSTKHLVHTTDGKVIGEWGMRKWLQSADKKTVKRTNIHIARQSLRLALFEQLPDSNNVQWNHQFIDFKQIENGKVEINFKVEGKLKTATTDLIVGADGIRSSVRNKLIDPKSTPLRYLDCIVILGICPLSNLDIGEHELLDSATVFQTANGNERIYVMPYDSKSVMWQLSFPMSEEDAITLSKEGPKALKQEACRRTQWHKPIPQILEATLESQISGYPVYDRELLTPNLLSKNENATLIGDAAHPMSPFKGQGANQALLDALTLARLITKECRPKSNWRERGIRATFLSSFESDMLERTAVKVKHSAEAAQFLHSQIVLHEGDEPRGRSVTRNKE